MNYTYIINSAGAPAILSGSSEDSVAVPDGATIIEKDEFDQRVSDAIEKDRIRVEAELAEASRISAEREAEGRKRAQEAYNGAIASGLPEVVAVGIARAYLPGFEAV